MNLAAHDQLSYQFNFTHTELSKKFGQVVLLARDRGLRRDIGDKLVDEFLNRLSSFTSASALLEGVRVHTAGTDPQPFSKLLDESADKSESESESEVEVEGQDEAETNAAFPADRHRDDAAAWAAAYEAMSPQERCEVDTVLYDWW